MKTITIRLPDVAEELRLEVKRNNNKDRDIKKTMCALQRDEYSHLFR